MKLICLFSAVFCAQATALALTPYNLDLSQIKTCKVKYEVSGEETLLTSIAGLNAEGKIVTEFGTPEGRHFATYEESKAAKEYLLKSGICSEIRAY